MAKYVINRLGELEALGPGDDVTLSDAPVIVLPEADWREMVRLWPLMWNDRGEVNTTAAVQIDAIIQRTEQSNA